MTLTFFFKNQVIKVSCHIRGLGENCKMHFLCFQYDALQSHNDIIKFHKTTLDLKISVHMDFHITN